MEAILLLYYVDLEHLPIKNFEHHCKLKYPSNSLYIKSELSLFMSIST